MPAKRRQTVTTDPTEAEATPAPADTLPELRRALETAREALESEQRQLADAERRAAEADEALAASPGDETALTASMREAARCRAWRIRCESAERRVTAAEQTLADAERAAREAERDRLVERLTRTRIWEARTPLVREEIAAIMALVEIRRRRVRMREDLRQQWRQLMDLCCALDEQEIARRLENEPTHADDPSPVLEELRQRMQDLDDESQRILHAIIDPPVRRIAVHVPAAAAA